MKKMKNIKILNFIFVCMLLQSFVLAAVALDKNKMNKNNQNNQTTEPAKDNKTLEDVTVQAELNLKVDSEKPKIDLVFNKDTILQSQLDLEQNLLEKEPDSLNNVLLALPKIIFSKNTISPFLCDIVNEPVLKFRIKPVKTFKIKKFDINIMDSRGELFNIISGKSSIPSSIEWDGRDNKKNMVIPGNWYSYNVKLIDEFNDTYTVKGETFKFKGVVYTNKKEKIISLSLSELFDIGLGKIELKPEGKILLNEALDIIKENCDKSIKLVVYDSKDKLAFDRGGKILDYVISNLYIGDVKINIQAVPSYISEYRVDFVIFG